MRILYIFPHPDDESFGPGPAIARQRRQGHEVFLHTLTRGGATKQRHELGYTVEQMGQVRYREMQDVARVLDLSGMTVLDLPDSGLSELDPRVVEAAVRDGLQRCRPHIVVTYAYHGVSGQADHLVTHCAVKRCFCELNDAEQEGHYRRLALFTLDEEQQARGNPILRASAPEAIDAVVEVDEEDLRIGTQSLACYETYRAVIEREDPLQVTGDQVCFELFQESFDPPLGDLTDRL